MAACQRLCDLINTSLHRYIVSPPPPPPPHLSDSLKSSHLYLDSSLSAAQEGKPTPLDRETEKGLILALSRVSREIEQWTNETSSVSEQAIIVKLLSNHNCFHHLEKPFRGDFNCLANIVSAMVAFLSFESRFVQHLSGKILVSASCFLAQFGNNWVEFLHLLWISLDVSVSSNWACTSSPPPLVGSSTLSDKGSSMHCQPCTDEEVSETEEPIYNFTNFIALLQSRLVNRNSVLVAALFQILRNILKSLKQDFSDLQGVFMHLAVSSLSKLPWNKLNTSQMLTSEANLGRECLLDETGCSARHLDILFGSIIQLLCSLVEQKDPEDVGGGSLEEFSVYSNFTNLVPKLLFCFSKCLGDTNKRLCGYFRHKVLMLMIRLSYHKNWRSSFPTMWLNLLRQYFEDLLYERISECDAEYENTLDGSPFLSSFADGDEVHYPCPRNLQRQAIFLLFRCCFTLSRVSKDTAKGCRCAVGSSSLTNGVNLCSEDCCLRGLSELFEWLQKSDLLKKFVDSEDYSKSYSSFALSFLRLYTEDDDMLLKMLLQLLDAPLFTMPSNAEDRSFEELNRDISFHFSSIFNPIHLFHMFLLLLHYDHSVLIDYLISKDTGIHCVKYLLRCLRIICESWLVFVKFSICGTEIDQSCHKRRKISANEDCSRKSRPFSSSSSVVNSQHSRWHKSRSMNKAVNIKTFVSAKECLLSLKRSVEDLHEKKLFPYNPKPLLRRFSRFQELCEHEECAAAINDNMFSPS